MKFHQNLSLVRRINPRTLRGLLLVAVSSLGLWVALIPAWSLLSPKGEVVAVDCDLSLGPCTVNLDGQSVTVRFDNLPLQPLNDNRLILASAAPLSSASVRLMGAEMNMGVTDFRFAPETQSKWVSSIFFPVCTQSRMRWLLQLHLETASQTKDYQFSLTIGSAT